jgi:tRNA (adenine22-N1)-methyltransferase
VKHPVGNRLLSAARFVRQDAYFADIGTDHAYLPIFLLSRGVIERAVCSDVNAGPLASAEKNAKEAGFIDKIEFHLTDGASALAHLPITDYAICGMGGELISYIIDRAPHLKNEEINLILQPMTRQSELRRYLAENGFFVIDEAYSYEAGKYYVCINARYDGVKRHISDLEAEFGNLAHRVELSLERQGYIETKLRALEKARDGKAKGGDTSSYEHRVLVEYERFLAKGKENDC